LGAVDATHERILDGAVRAVLRQGLGALAMRDIGACAGVARGTVYRYFPNREALLEELMRREGRRFLEQWRRTLAEAPEGETRMLAAFAWPARFAREHPLLHRVIETDPDYVLRAIRENHDAIHATVAELLGSIFADNELVRRGVVSIAQITDWAVRIMVSTLLFPAQDPEELLRGLAAIHRALHGAPREPTGTR
jgi:AcrR family transcriptional regulator